MKNNAEDAYPMSMDIPVEIGLDELVRESCYILVVERGSPFEKVEMVPLGEPGSKCPPFRRVSYRYRIAEVLKSRSQKSLGPEIEVFAPFTSMGMDLHRAYYLEGESISPYRPEYRSKADFSSEKLIVFLNSGREFTVAGAYEALEQKKAVLEAIARGGAGEAWGKMEDD